MGQTQTGYYNRDIIWININQASAEEIHEFSEDLSNEFKLQAAYISLKSIFDENEYALFVITFASKIGRIGGFENDKTSNEYLKSVGYKNVDGKAIKQT